ncbi:GNAT family N-acetyltransferase [Liquorilactobacillus vini]|uniref:GNAT family N-acetyltransferase n=1 Tax=Liquorilactobacillus vini TaxID=238015 RepID=UPI000305A04F|nr:GNAT family N-acetyltransferase [Liquorilactobacillus vini]
MVQIRKMTIADYDQAYALWQKTPGMHLHSLDNSQAGIKQVIDHNPTLCFVAEDQNNIVGTILGATDGRKGYFYHMAVAEKYRHQQIGSQLIANVLKGLKQQNIQKVGLFTVTDNLQGQNFWKHLGFKERPDIKYFDLDL